MPKGIYQRSQEQKDNMRSAKTGKKRKPFSKETKKRMSEAQKGKKLSQETKDKIGKNGFHTGMLGKKMSLENRIKLSNRMKGEKSPLWKGGKSKEEYGEDWDETLKNSIRERDSFICQECGIHQDEMDIWLLKKLDVHHIDYNKHNLNPDNLISLCRSCHIKTNYNREYWIEYFTKK